MNRLTLEVLQEDVLSENKDIIWTCAIYEQSRKLDYLEANGIIWQEN